MSTASDPAAQEFELPEPVDVRLVVTDMDGTLLDGDSQIPPDLWPLLDEMHARGIVFAPASGRQYSTLARQFASVKDHLAFIAENGTMVVWEGEVVGLHPLDHGEVVRIVGKTREMRAEGFAISGIRCGRESAYVEGSDSASFAEQVSMYYATMRQVPDMLAPHDDTLKFSIYDDGDAEHGSGPIMREFAAPNQVVVSTGHWLDIMAPGVNKGSAVADLQRTLGVTPAQTVVFGDYLNDLEMMSAGDHSYAMANAHPDVLEAAAHRAPAHQDHGVITTLRALLGL